MFKKYILVKKKLLNYLLNIFLLKYDTLIYTFSYFFYDKSNLYNNNF